jgi:hypothetical protein
MVTFWLTLTHCDVTFVALCHVMLPLKFVSFVSSDKFPAMLDSFANVE